MFLQLRANKAELKIMKMVKKSKKELSKQRNKKTDHDINEPFIFLKLSILI